MHISAACTRTQRVRAGRAQPSPAHHPQCTGQVGSYTRQHPRQVKAGSCSECISSSQPVPVIPVHRRSSPGIRASCTGFPEDVDGVHSPLRPCARQGSRQRVSLHAGRGHSVFGHVLLRYLLSPQLVFHDRLTCVTKFVTQVMTQGCHDRRSISSLQKSKKCGTLILLICHGGRR